MIDEYVQSGYKITVRNKTIIGLKLYYFIFRTI